MNKFIAAILCSAIIIPFLPSAVGAQVAEKKPPRKYDKLLTTVEGFAKLNAQIEIREKEFSILAPYVQTVVFYADGLKSVCDSKCGKSVDRYYPRLKSFTEALYEAHRRYLAMSPNITSRNADLMSEIKRVAMVPDGFSKEKVISSLNQLDLENLYHYKQYANTYHSADKAMLSLAASSDITQIINSFASTTDRLVKIGRPLPKTEVTIQTLQDKVPDIRERMKALEDRRKSLVCTAVLAADWSVDVRCLP